MQDDKKMIIVIWCENGKVALRLGGGQSESMAVYGQAISMSEARRAVYMSLRCNCSLSLYFFISLSLSALPCAIRPSNLYYSALPEWLVFGGVLQFYFL